jgi:ribonuclease HI
MAKAYRTTSNEALCMTGMTPIILKLEEVVKRYTIIRGLDSCKIELDHDVEFKYRPHLAEAVKMKEIVGYEETSVQANNDGSKHNKGVGSGAAIFIGGVMEAQIKIKLDNRCSNNQAEQQAILKPLEAINSLNKHTINPRTATIFTDSRVSIDSLWNPNNHAYLVEKIRKMVAILERREWKIMFSWVKAHAGKYGNELADRLAN